MDTILAFNASRSSKVLSSSIFPVLTSLLFGQAGLLQNEVIDPVGRLHGSITLKYKTPSTVNEILSLVIALGLEHRQLVLERPIWYSVNKWNDKIKTWIELHPIFAKSFNYKGSILWHEFNTHT